MTGFEKAWLDSVRREVYALARSTSPGADSWRRLKSALLAAANCVRQEAGENSAPIGLTRIKELRQIRRELLFRGDDAPDAILIPVAGGFTLNLRADQPKVRRRFSTAHEIAHTFFYDTDKSPPARIISQDASTSLSPKEEDVCSAFARELLLPAELVRPETLALTPSNALEAVSRLAKQYEVSTEVVTRRLMSDWARLEASIAVFWEVVGEEDGRAVRSRWYKGRAVRRYLRRSEEEVFKRILEIVDTGPPYTALDEAKARYESCASIQWSASRSSPRFVALLNFHR